MAENRAAGISAQKPRSVAQGRRRSSSIEEMYPSPLSHPTANSSRSSGVHIHVTSGVPFTSSQTGTSSTAASSDIRPPRFSGRRGSGGSGAVGMEGRVLGDADAH